MARHHILSAIFTRKTTFKISCLLSYLASPSAKEVYSRRVKERHDCKGSSLNYFHTNIKKQGLCVKLECELQHGYLYKMAESRYEAICWKFGFESETCLSFSYVFFWVSKWRYMVLGGSWKKLRSLKLSLCLKVCRTVAASFDVLSSAVAMLWRH